jgi:hypothetical protein
MDSSDQEKELRITNINYPIMRVGYANFVIVVSFFLMILFNQLISDLSFSALSRFFLLALITTCTIKIYLHSVAKFYNDENKSLTVLGPLFKKRIFFSDIVKMKIFGIPASMTIVLMVKTKNSALPSFFYFVAVSNLLGTYNETKEKLASLLETGVVAGDRGNDG